MLGWKKMWNHADTGTQFVGPSEMIANLEHLDLKALRVTSQYLLSNTFGMQGLDCKLNEFICKLSSTK